jgi:formylglycine-generating enzyme required for sulfatase activity
MGDTRPGHPAADLGQNPLTPHWVRLSGFYIQESEVTHEEIESYRNDHPEADESLRSWNEYYKRLRSITKPEERAKRFPAVCLNYRTARKYAEDMSGRLPTEAEWEYVAKSCVEKNIFPWGRDIPRATKPKANVLQPAGFLPHPVEVMITFPEDKSDQGVFDLAGNVREYCLDTYAPYPPIQGNSVENPLIDPGRNGEASGDGKAKYVVRGGSFQLLLDRAMAFQRDRVSADESLDDVGFRVVIECPPVNSAR